MIARASKLFLPTLRDAPADADAVSHKLLVRAGFIRQVAAGLWTFTPLGWRVHRKVEQRLRDYSDAFEVAVMGCAVNGPGEAGDADFGIAGGRDVGFIYAHGRVLKKVSSDILIDELFYEIDVWIAGGMKRPKRLKMAKPAALAMAEASLIPLE